MYLKTLLGVHALTPAHVLPGEPVETCLDRRVFPHAHLCLQHVSVHVCTCCVFADVLVHRALCWCCSCMCLCLHPYACMAVCVHPFVCMCLCADRCPAGGEAESGSGESPSSFSRLRAIRVSVPRTERPGQVLGRAVSGLVG